MLWNTIWDLDEKLASCQVNCLNNHCYKICKFNYCNYFMIVNQGIQKLENPSNSQARSSARERCCYWYESLPDTHVRRPHPTTLAWNTKVQSGFKSCFLKKWKIKALTKFIWGFSKIISKLNYQWSWGEGCYHGLKQGTCVWWTVAIHLPGGAHTRGEEKNIRAKKTGLYSYYWSQILCLHWCIL